MKYILILVLLACGGSEYNDSVLISENSAVLKDLALEDVANNYKLNEWKQLVAEYQENKDLKELMVKSIDYLDVVNHFYIEDKTYLQFLLQELITDHDDFKLTLFFQMINDSRLIMVDSATRTSFFLQLNHLLMDHSNFALELIDKLYGSGKILRKDNLVNYEHLDSDWVSDFLQLVMNSRFLNEEEMFSFINSVQLLYLVLVKTETDIDQKLFSVVLDKALKQVFVNEIPNAIDILCWNYQLFKNNYRKVYRDLTTLGIIPSDHFKMVLDNGIRGEDFSCAKLRRINRMNRKRIFLRKVEEF